MKKVYKLTLNGGFLLNREPFIVADNEELELCFETDYKPDNAYIILKNGDVTRKDKLTSFDSYKVSRELLFAGKLSMQIELMACGKVAKRLVPEPIVVRELDGQLIGAPEVEAFMQAVEQRMNAAEAVAKEADRRMASRAEIYAKVKSLIDSGAKR